MENLEKTFYPIVSKWLEKTHLCFKTAENTGLKFSRADVIGIRDIGGDLTGEIETIVVEVKRGSEPFATASGQTYGYIVYANRVYLADKRPNGFSQEELQIASHLGIGLISIDKKNKCHEVLSSPYYKPLTKLNTLLLEKLKLGMCQLCQCYIEIGDEKNNHNRMEKKKLQKAIDNEKGFMFWNFEISNRKEKLGVRVGRENSTYERRFLCRDCVGILGQLNTAK
jgi:hypothetical protein